jgi:putative transposase
MSNYIRPHIPGATVYFTVNLAKPGSRLLTDEILHLRSAVRATWEDRPFHINAWVVLPDHMHAIWTLPPGDADFSTRWGSIKARFTMSLRRAGFSPPPDLPMVQNGRYAGLKPGLRVKKRETGIWQRRFWEHHVRSPEEYHTLVRDCWMDPVKHGLTDRPENWPYSSVHRDKRIGTYAFA